MSWTGPEDSEGINRAFVAMVGARSVVDGAFFASSDTTQSRAAFLTGICYSRGTWPSRQDGAGASPLCVEDLLPPGERRSFRTYLWIVRRFPNPDMRKRCRRSTPPLMKSSRMCTVGCAQEPVFFSPGELNFAHGWPSIPVASNEGCRQAGEHFAKLKPTEQQSLTGNGVHLPVFAAWLAFRAAHTYPKSQMYRIDRASSARAAELEEGDDDEFDFL